MANETLAMLAVTYDQDRPSNFSQLSVATFKDEEGNIVGPIEGTAALDFMGQFDYVICWHWLPQQVIAVLHTYGTQVILAHAVAHVTQQAQWDRKKNTLRSALLGPFDSRLLGLSSNSFGEPYVDVYEQSQPMPPHPPHSWAINMMSARTVEQYKQAFQNIIDVHYDKTRPDGHFVDVVNSRRYWGSASNDEGLDPDMHWKRWVDMFQSNFGPFWGHTSIDDMRSGVSDVHNRIEEWAFRDKNVPQLITEMQAFGGRFCPAPNNGPADINELRTLRSTNIPFIEQRCRTSFWGFDLV